ncbi:invasion associated locus B family protein [Bartonella schoenbuchensis]|uniref:Invasion protein IalB, involved in pathogenesis n=2 Tax=Bartonella schoenbuchensis TaxID=165694 RepID=A0A1S6XNL1_BARSR|nr:invasion associated locus B family protein [Bartonella schoenbuchensis]AQX30239.1 Invasion protein IalB, involved in pathogenesis [Bartonella schoenbuchensis R1]CDP79734.1 invasion associated locus B family protein [Bartonella schoenbuchensis]
MIRNRKYITSLLFILVFLGKAVSFAEEQESVYTVHPPQLSVPGGKPGETRRIIMQFDYWTLICDENKTIKQGICNVTQTIHNDKEGNKVFSWSLVSTKNGQPVMLLRTLPNANTNAPIQVFMEGVEKPLLISYKQCNREICLAQYPVGPVLMKQISKSSNVRISYQLKEGKTLSFVAPFKGLGEALLSLQ